MCNRFCYSTCVVGGMQSIGVVDAHVSVGTGVCVGRRRECPCGYRDEYGCGRRIRPVCE